MRHVEKAKNNINEVIIPNFLNTREINSHWDKLVSKTEKPPESVKTELKKEIIKELNKYYHGKCAYCENRLDLEVEHYRPKAHYYWLYYEWTNLLPACHDCNTFGSKGNQFTVTGIKETLPPLIVGTSRLNKSLCKHDRVPLKNEKPYLLHPEYDNPTDFLKFEINSTKKGIDIAGKDDVGRGEETRRICNLNRIPLILNRQEDVVDNFRNQLRNTLKKAKGIDLQEDKTIELLKIDFEQFEEDSKNEKLKYTLLRKYIIETVENFKLIIAPFFEENQKKLIVLAFEKYKTS